MPTSSEARALDPTYVAAQLSQVTDTDPAAPLSALRERLFLSGYDTSSAADNKAIDPATGNVISQNGSRLLLPTPVDANTVYELDSISDLQGVYSYRSNTTGGYKFLATLQNVPQLPGEPRYYSASPALPLDSQDNILYFLGSLSKGQDLSSLYIYRTDRYAGTGGASGAIPFGPLTATGAAGETFALPAGTKSVRGVQVFDANPGPGQYPVVGLTSNMYTLDTSAVPPTLSVLPPYTLSANDTIEGIAFMTASAGGGGGTPTPAPAAPTDLAVNSQRVASFTPASGKTAANYAYSLDNGTTYADLPSPATSGGKVSFTVPGTSSATLLVRLKAEGATPAGLAVSASVPDTGATTDPSALAYDDTSNVLYFTPSSGRTAADYGTETL
jgi:hypothetical protein